MARPILEQGSYGLAEHEMPVCYIDQQDQAALVGGFIPLRLGHEFFEDKSRKIVRFV